MFEYYNNNPKGKHTSDCIIRSIALFTGKPYQQVMNDLIDLSVETGYHIADPVCFSVYMMRNHYKVHTVNDKIFTCDDLCKYVTEKDFTELPGLTEDNCNNLLVCIGAKHVTCVQNGIIYDTVNCGYGRITSYYVV